MVKEEILRLLNAPKAGYVSGGELAKRLKVSRTAVWKHVRALIHDGYEIEAVPSKGYRLTARPDKIDLSILGQALGTRVLGREIRLLNETSSTNTLAMEIAQGGAAEGVVVIAESQTAGRGRLGRGWVSPPGNIYMSVILRPQLPPHKAPLVTLAAAVAAAVAVRKSSGVIAEIKWPNDILVRGRKIGGILTEMSAEPERVKHIILGMGINVNMDPAKLPRDIRGRSTSLSKEVGREMDRSLFAAGVLNELEHWYQALQRNEALVLKEWEVLNMTIGRRVAVSGPLGGLEGKAEGIDPEGRLILRLDDNTLRTVAAGDVIILKDPASGVRGSRRE